MVSLTTLRIFEVILVVPFVVLGLRYKLSSKEVLVLSFTIMRIKRKGYTNENRWMRIESTHPM